MTPPVELKRPEHVHAQRMPRRPLETGTPPRPGGELGRDAADISAAGKAAPTSPVTAAPVSSELGEILRIIDSARTRIREKVKAVIDANQKEMSEAAKQALARKKEKLLQMAAHIQKLLRDNPKLQAKVGNILVEMRAIEGMLAGLDSLSDPTAVEAKLTEIERLLRKVESMCDPEMEKAKRLLVFILNGRLSERGIGEGDAQKTVDAIAGEWEAGTLTLDFLNKQLKEHGIILSEDFVACLLQGKGAELLDSVGLGKRAGFLRFVKNLFYTLQFWAYKKIEVNLEEALEKMDSSNADVSDEFRKRSSIMFEQLKLGGNDTDFYVIDFDRQGRDIAAALGLTGKGPADWWKALAGKLGESDWLRGLYDRLHEQVNLSTEEKWERLVAEIIGRLFDKIVYEPDRDQYKDDRKHAQVFKKLMLGVQGEREPKVEAAYLAALQRLIIRDDKVDPDKVLDGEKGETVAMKADPRKEAVPQPGGGG